jgi:cytochrome b561
MIPLRNTAERYGAVAQFFHWTIVALVLAQFTLGLMAQGLPIGMERLILLSRHKALGMTLFGLVLLRLAWRLYSPAPPLPATLSLRLRRLARGTHALLYALLLAMPVVGWVSSSASNLTVSWFGLFEFPNLADPDPRVAESTKAIHAAMAGLLLATVSLHVIAALWHHTVRRDDVLWRMLPIVRRPSREKTP